MKERGPTGSPVPVMEAPQGDARIEGEKATVKAKEHFWHLWDELLSSVPQLPDEAITAMSTCICTLVAQPRRCLKSWSCNMQCDTMRPETGSISRIGPSSLTSPFSPNVNCSSHSVSSIRRPRRGDELTS